MSKVSLEGGVFFHFFFSNANGMKVGLTNFGARIVEVLLPVEEDGGVRNVSLSGSTDEEIDEQICILVLQPFQLQVVFRGTKQK